MTTTDQRTAVLGLHQPIEFLGIVTCRQGCRDTTGGIGWPCETAAIFDPPADQPPVVVTREIPVSEWQGDTSPLVTDEVVEAYARADYFAWDRFTFETQQQLRGEIRRNLEAVAPLIIDRFVALEADNV